MSLTLSAIFWGIVTFSLLVVLHEGGHMVAARAFGVKVHEFFLGLPGPSLSFKHKETQYGVTCIPLGGYVRIAGMEGNVDDPRLGAVLAWITRRGTADIAAVSAQFALEDKEASALMAVLEDWDAVTFDAATGLWTAAYAEQDAEDTAGLLARAKEHTFLALKTWQRLVVLVAGVTVNIIVALAVFTIVLAGWGTYVDKGHVDPAAKGPAALAGVRANDRIVALDGTKVATFSQVPTLLKKKHRVGETAVLTVVRTNQTLRIPVVLGKNPKTGAPFLGVTLRLTHDRPGLVRAFGQSFRYLKLTAQALLNLFNPQTFQSTVKQSTSIVGISVMAAQAAAAGALEYAWLIAAISLSLGLMNVLPIPPLDGGKMVIEIIGGIRRKAVPMKVQVGLSLAGFVALFALVIVLTFNDFTRIIK